MGLPWTDGTRSLVRDCEKNGVPCDHLPVRDGGAMALWRAPCRVVRALRFIRKREPDAVIMNLAWPDRSLALIVACAMLRLPTIVRFGVIPFVFPFGGIKKGIYRWAFKQNIRLLTISRNNQELASQTFGVPRDEVEVVYNGVAEDRRYIDLEGKPRADIRQQLRAQLGIRNDALILLTVGRLSEQKGYREACVILPEIMERYPDVHCVWVGEGEQRPALTGLIRETGMEGRVHMIGHREDVPFWMAGSDLFFFPTRYEGGQSFVISESMLYGLPIVSSDASGIPEVLEHHEEAVLFRNGDAESMKSALIWALENPDKRLEYARRARLKSGRFTRQGMVARVNDIVCDLLRDP